MSETSKQSQNDEIAKGVIIQRVEHKHLFCTLLHNDCPNDAIYEVRTIDPISFEWACQACADQAQLQRWADPETIIMVGRRPE